MRVTFDSVSSKIRNLDVVSIKGLYCDGGYNETVT